jgi:hypothetical protein
MRSILTIFCLFSGIPTAFAAEDAASVLARILAGRGTITSSELARVESVDVRERVNVLASLLQQKGVLTPGDVAMVEQAPSSQTATAPVRLIPAVMANGAPQTQPIAAPRPGSEVSPAVTSQSKLPVTVYGTLLVNAFYDTSLTNIQDIPLFAGKQNSDALGNDKSFGMTARQSRIGMRYQGPEVAGARISGQAEVDFLGGKAAFGNGINMDLVRLRLAFGRLDWKNFSLEAGQDWSIFAPLNPTTLAEFAIPGLSASGNPWIRMPQIRAEFRANPSDTTRVQFQVAAIDPDVGDYNTAVFASTRTPGIGERGRYPGVDARLGVSTRASGRDFSFGLSSHYSRGKNAGVVGSQTIQTGVDSWGTALDYTLPFTKVVALSGEWYAGKALGIYSVASGESVLPVGTPGQSGVRSLGGWSQLQFNLNPKWQTNLAYGIDTEKNRQLRTGDRNKNQTYTGNVIYKYSPHVNFAWEWRRFLTTWKNQQFANENGDHI